MNQYKIGKFIAKLRKEKKLTQEELAEKLNVNNRTISRWENGNYMPDIASLKSLSEILEVSLSELLNGERLDQEEISKKAEETVENTLILSDNLIKKNKQKMLKIFFTIIISIIFVISIIFLINNYKSIISYSFRGMSENFAFESGLITYSKDNGYINITDFTLKDNHKLDINKINNIEITILFDNTEWANSSWGPKENENNNLINWLEKNTFGEEANLNQNCWYACSSDSFTRSNKEEFPENMQIKIKYCLNDNTCKTEEMKFGYDIIAQNKLF